MESLYLLVPLSVALVFLIGWAFWRALHSGQFDDLEIRVECYAGYRGEQEPRAFTLGETRFAVLDILDRWVAPGQRYFKVKSDDGRTLVLRHDTASGEWQLAGMVGAPRRAPPGAKTLH